MDFNFSIDHFFLSEYKLPHIVLNYVLKTIKLIIIFYSKSFSCNYFPIENTLKIVKNVLNKVLAFDILNMCRIKLI